MKHFFTLFTRNRSLVHVTCEQRSVANVLGF